MLACRRVAAILWVSWTVGCSASGGGDTLPTGDAVAETAVDAAIRDDAVVGDVIFPLEDGCVPTIVECSFPNCNSSLGDDEAKCMALGNPGGCERSGTYGDVLKAWCTRRVGSGIAWDNIRSGFVLNNCGSLVVEMGYYVGRSGCKTCRCRL